VSMDRLNHTDGRCSVESRYESVPLISGADIPLRERRTMRRRRARCLCD
jgi:hypothetical protein